MIMREFVYLFNILGNWWSSSKTEGACVSIKYFGLIWDTALQITVPSYSVLL